MNDKEFAAKLKSIRICSGKTVPEISSFLISLGYKASEKTIYSWEAGRSQPSPDAFLDLCQFCSVTDLLSTFGYKAASSTAEATPGEEQLEADTLRPTLLHNFGQLNQEGKEKLVDLSDDMVATGKYIKSDPDKLGKAKNA